METSTNVFQKTNNRLALLANATSSPQQKWHLHLKSTITIGRQKTRSLWLCGLQHTLTRSKYTSRIFSRRKIAAQSMLAKLAVPICLLLTSLEALPKGHLEPFGQQAKEPVLGIDEVKGFLTPKIFFEKYVLKNRPLLMRGAAKASPAWSKWTDEYLKNQVNNITV